MPANALISYDKWTHTLEDDDGDGLGKWTNSLEDDDDEGDGLGWRNIIGCHVMPSSHNRYSAIGSIVIIRPL